MGDTTTIEVNETWQQFFSTTGSSFTFSNQGPNEVYVRESINQPAPRDRGYVFIPSKGGAGKVEFSPFWVRARTGKSFFHFGAGAVDPDEAFFPNKLVGLKLWLDADDASTILKRCDGF